MSEKKRIFQPCKCGEPLCEERLPSHYPLDELTPELRMLAFMHAIGQDVSEIVEEIRHRNDDLAVDNKKVQHVYMNKRQSRNSFNYRREGFK